MDIPERLLGIIVFALGGAGVFCISACLFLVGYPTTAVAISAAYFAFVWRLSSRGLVVTKGDFYEFYKIYYAPPFDTPDKTPATYIAEDGRFEVWTKNALYGAVDRADAMVAEQNVTKAEADSWLNSIADFSRRLSEKHSSSSAREKKEQ